MAISESARELVLDVARRAKERGATVVFDPNFRPALPDTPEAAAARQRAVLEHVDWYLCGEGEAELLLAATARSRFRSVIRVGARGAIVDGVEVPPPRTASVVDEVGAGDAFAAGFVYGLLHGLEPRGVRASRQRDRGGRARRDRRLGDAPAPRRRARRSRQRKRSIVALTPSTRDGCGNGPIELLQRARFELGRERQRRLVPRDPARQPREPRPRSRRRPPPSRR